MRETLECITVLLLSAWRTVISFILFHIWLFWLLSLQKYLPLKGRCFLRPYFLCMVNGFELLWDIFQENNVSNAFRISYFYSKSAYQATPKWPNDISMWQRNDTSQRIICTLIKLAAERRGISSFFSLGMSESEGWFVKVNIKASILTIVSNICLTFYLYI